VGIVSAVRSFFSPKPSPSPAPKSSPPTNSTSTTKAPTTSIPFTPTPTKSNPFVSNPIVRSGGGGSSIAPTSSGTYNSSTGVYTDSSGNSQSRAVAPQGATLVGGGKTTYSGGGSSSSSSSGSTSNPLANVFPSVTTSSNPFNQAINQAIAERKLSVAPTTNSKAGGTYNPTTQTYTDKSGLGYSMKPSH